MKTSKTPPIKELRKICRPHTPWLGLLSFCFPRISIYFSKMFIAFNMSANTVSGLMTLFALLTGVLLSFQNYYLHIAAVFSLFFSFTLDWCDGEVARYYRIKEGAVTFDQGENINSVNFKSKHSFVGNFLDWIYHLFVKLSVFLGISVYCYTRGELLLSIISLLAAFLFLLAQQFSSFRKEVFLVYLKNNEAQYQFRKGEIKNRDPKSISYFFLGEYHTIAGLGSYYIIAFFVIMGWQNWLVIIAFVIYFYLVIKNIADAVMGKYGWEL